MFRDFWQTFKPETRIDWKWNYRYKRVNDTIKALCQNVWIFLKIWVEQLGYLGSKINALLLLDENFYKCITKRISLKVYVKLCKYFWHLGTTSGTLQACYNCIGATNSTCGTGDFNSSDSNIFVSDCLHVYHYENTTEAVCVTLSGPTTIPNYGKKYLFININRIFFTFIDGFYSSFHIKFTVFKCEW